MLNGRVDGCLVPLVKSRRPFLRVLVWFLCFQMALNSLGLSMLLAAGPVVNPIEKDGSTDTILSFDAEKRVVDIHTNTKSNDTFTRYNAFKTFGVQDWQTVNLYLDGSNNLVNVVRQGPTTINGILNAIKGGAIGGNVYFAVPSGFVVGSSGVLNVGSLSVKTLSTTDIDDVFRDGFNQVKAGELMTSNISVVEDGLISIRGRINAMGDVILNGGKILVKGAGGSQAGIRSGAVFKYTAPDFSDVVNVAGLPEGTGNIHLIATGKNSAIITVSDAELSAPGAVSLQATANNTVPLMGFQGAGVRIAIAKADTKAEAVVDEHSSLYGGASVSVAAHAETHVAGDQAVSDGGVLSIPGAASFSLSDIKNTATARIGGETTVSTKGDLTVHARGLTDVVTVADASVAGATGAAASLALSFVDQQVTAEIVDNAVVTESGAVSVTADGKMSQVTSATAGVGGGGGSSLADILQGVVKKEVLASTQEAALTGLIDDASGSLGGEKSGPQVAGAVAFAKTGHITIARITSTKGVTSTGDVTVKTGSHATVDTQASGITNNDATSGIGAAVAITTGRVENSAELGSTVAAGGAVTVAATQGETEAVQPFSTRAYSGQGAKGVGFAGALTIHNLSTLIEATVTDDVHITATDLSLSAKNMTSHTALADGTGTDAEGADPKVGVGVSVALNFGENRTQAILGGGASADLSGNLSLAAESGNTSRTEAVAGATGGTAIVPVLALSNTRDDTRAVVAKGTGTLDIDGSVAITSAHRHDNETMAKGSAGGGTTAAVGLAASVALTEDTNTAAIDRNLAVTGTGAIALTAEGSVSVASSGIASAGGAADNDPEEKGLNSKLDTFFALKGSMNKTEVPEGETAPEGKKVTQAETSEGGISLAAAVGVTDVESENQARIGAGAVVSTEGDIALISRSQLDVSATGDGSASGGAFGIGAGVAINVATHTVRAEIGAGADITAKTLSLAAQTRDPENPDVKDERNEFTATAKAGAGGSKLAIAGSAAINVVNNTTDAVVDGILNVSDSVTLSSDNTSEAKATAGAVASKDGSGEATGSVGVGASFATNKVTNQSLARVGANAQMTMKAKTASLTLGASSHTSQVTKAIAGNDPHAAGGVDNAVSLDAAVALNVDDNLTRAVIEEGTGLETGAVTLLATAVDANITEARGDASGDKAAVGASVAIGTNNAKTEALVNRNLTVTGAVTITAKRTSDDRVTAEATAKGVDLQRYLDRFNKSGDDEILNGEFGGDENPKTPESSKALSKHKAKTGKGGISVAAAVGVNVVNDTTRSQVADGVTLTATGSVALAADETSRFETKGSGKAVGKGAGIGVGVAITSLGKTTKAIIGDETKRPFILKGTTIKASGNLTVSAEAHRNTGSENDGLIAASAVAVSYTHLRAHET